MAGGKGRLNFTITDDLSGQLSAYCDRTGRSPSDVIRQLVIEWIEGDRQIAGKASEHPVGRRTNIPLGYATLAELDRKVVGEGHVTASAAIAELLTAFLTARGEAKTEETISFGLQIPTKLYTQVIGTCEREETTLERFLLEAIRDSLKARRSKNKGG